MQRQTKKRRLMQHIRMSNKTDDIILLISLARISFLNLTEKLNLLKKLDSYNDLAILSIEDIKNITSRNIRAVWDGRQNLLAARKEAAILEAKKIKYLLYGDEGYPALLKETPNAPFMLFYTGDASCLTGRTVSVVGTRRIAPEAKHAAVQFAYDAACDGCTVVSGLAKGVDGAAHTGAVNARFDSFEDIVSAEGRTAAVLPCGIDTVVPSGHKALAEQIVKTGGCIVSEYVPGTPAENWRFVQRNRIVAALSPATVVIQAPDGSGALITAQYALDYSRDVVFHKAAFSRNAEDVRSLVKAQLEKDFAAGNVSKGKIENTCEKYIEAGAPIIGNYKEYCDCMTALPGTYSLKNEQLNLF